MVLKRAMTPHHKPKKINSPELKGKYGRIVAESPHCAEVYDLLAKKVSAPAISRHLREKYLFIVDAGTILNFKKNFYSKYKKEEIVLGELRPETISRALNVPEQIEFENQAMVSKNMSELVKTIFGLAERVKKDIKDIRGRITYVKRQQDIGVWDSGGEHAIRGYYGLIYDLEKFLQVSSVDIAKRIYLEEVVIRISNMVLDTFLPNIEESKRSMIVANYKVKLEEFVNTFMKEEGLREPRK